jgi:hypothetical protein
VDASVASLVTPAEEVEEHVASSRDQDDHHPQLATDWITISDCGHDVVGRKPIHASPSMRSFLGSESTLDIVHLRDSKREDLKDSSLRARTVVFSELSVRMRDADLVEAPVEDDDPLITESASPNPLGIGSGSVSLHSSSYHELDALKVMKGEGDFVVTELWSSLSLGGTPHQRRRRAMSRNLAGSSDMSNSSSLASLDDVGLRDQSSSERILQALGSELDPIDAPEV